MVGCKCVYMTDESLEGYKSKLIAKEFTQTYGMDYLETFVPLAKNEHCITHFVTRCSFWLGSAIV